MYDLYLTDSTTPTQAIVVKNLDYDTAEKCAYHWLNLDDSKDYIFINAGEFPEFLNVYKTIIEKPVFWVMNF